MVTIIGFTLALAALVFGVYALMVEDLWPTTVMFGLMWVQAEFGVRAWRNTATRMAWALAAATEGVFHMRPLGRKRRERRHAN